MIPRERILQPSYRTAMPLSPRDRVSTGASSAATSDLAFTILHEDDLDVEERNPGDGDEGIGSGEDARKSDSPPSEIQTLNANLLKEKLMNLTKVRNEAEKFHDSLNQKKREIDKPELQRKYHQQCHQPYKRSEEKMLNAKKLNNAAVTKQSRPPCKIKHINNNDSKRPIFMSTVKQGTFLEPPPEIAYLLGLGSLTTSTGGSNNSLNSSRDRHQQQTLLYSFSSRPRVVEPAKAKPRVRRELPYNNLMFDRRVVRGSTYAQPIPPRWNPYFGYAKLLSQTQEEAAVARQQEAKRRAMSRRRALGTQTRASRLKVTTPPPVRSRRHATVQTERCLEEILVAPIGREIGCQADVTKHLRLHASESQLAHAPRGQEVSTQIYPGDLCDFDTEVACLLLELAGGTLEQALLEVMQEEELAELQAEQRRFLELQHREKMEVDRLRRQASTEARRTAVLLSEGYLEDSLPTVIEGLRDAGFILDDVTRDGEAGFLSWLQSEVSNELTHMVNNKDILTDIVREILETRAEIYRVMSEEEEKHLNLGSSEDDDVKP